MRSEAESSYIRAGRTSEVMLAALPLSLPLADKDGAQRREWLSYYTVRAQAGLWTPLQIMLSSQQSLRGPERGQIEVGPWKATAPETSLEPQCGGRCQKPCGGLG